MSRQLAVVERIEQRVLGALRLIDATTGSPIDQPLELAAANARIARNRSGLYVIRSWTRLAEHAGAFEAPPPAPPPGSEVLVCAVHDPAGGYISRRVTLSLPRDPDPAHAAAPESLWRPADIPMYPAPRGRLGANWAALRVTVRETASGDALGGALLRVLTGTRVLARGLTDWRGEALVAVAGIPVTTWSSEPDAVIVTELAGELDGCFDPAGGTRTPSARIGGGFTPGTTALPDPQALEDARAGLPQAAVPVTLAAGRRIMASLSIDLP